ncbi:TRAP transporter large permease [Halalkalibacter oceani]|uniref:TRAP transporter large permease n=1 Tax=Halalkalibacter oceani TaxID=1653776 RepID=A0A9X2INX0_9BACI|nr:TRAP transporter large permease [Halalkalibacter oceani]MCM3715369.1 TRAP transporter large permease [Halalkalibacter oceani]
MITLLIALTFILLIVGAPIYISLLLSSMITMLLFTSTDPMVLIQRTFGGIDKFVLMSLPFYILAANAMDVGGLSKRILRWAQALVGYLHGGLAMTVQTAAMFFGALSGSSPATVAAIGKIMYPEMLKQKYPKSFSTGLILESGSISLIIPPSITLILYASATNTSVGSLFMAGLSAGIIFGLIILIYIYAVSKIKKIPKGEPFNIPVLWQSTKNAAWSLGIPIIIIVGISMGIFTPTEAAGVSALYAIFIGMAVYREITLKKLFLICKSSAIMSAQIMILIGAASAFGWLLTVGQGPQLLAEFLNSNFNSSLMFLLFLNIVLLILGMFLDASIALIVIAPLVLPTAISLGIDPIHLGIVMVLNLAIGTFTPPFGLNIFVGKSVMGLEVHEMIPGIMRFLIVALAGLLLITYLPTLSLFLPNMIFN